MKRGQKVNKDKQRAEIAALPTEPTGRLKTKFGWIETYKLSDQDYREALGIGITKLIEDGKLDYGSVRG